MKIKPETIIRYVKEHATEIGRSYPIISEETIASESYRLGVLAGMLSNALNSTDGLNELRRELAEFEVEEEIQARADSAHEEWERQKLEEGL